MSADMSAFGVTPAELTTLHAAVGSAAAAARQSVARLRASADGVAWQGPAGHSFRLAWEDWSAGASTVLAALDSLARLVGAAGSSYAATDESVRASVALS
jgi:WXG100 family type VII secretion target